MILTGDCRQTHIGIEKNPEYVTIARNRAAEAHGQTKLSITEWEDGI